MLISKLPNTMHPLTPIGPSDKARQMYIHKSRNEALQEAEEASCLASSLRDKRILHRRRNNAREVSKHALGQMKLLNTSAGAGPRTVYTTGQLALLQDALVEFALEHLRRHGFALVSVPEIIPKPIVEACGFATDSPRSQIYHVAGAEAPGWCLAGTSELALAAFCSGRQFNHGEEEEEIPDEESALGLCAVSRCFRQEISHKESALYRSHQFTKVEMYGVTKPDHLISEAMFNRIIRVQMELFAQLELHYRVLEMPSSELGRQCYRKVDIEAWMPGENSYGEISSASNCTDYQSSRLCIFWGANSKAGEQVFAHTLNGTACAIPRTMKAILEQHQQPDGTVRIPKALQPFMENEELIKNDDSFQTVF